jgi:hypothetical protein
MAEAEKRSTNALFREWRGGDAAAGQLMAQRFADWYYAISTSRLGESRGREPCETACARFGEGIGNVTEARGLVTWAHNIIKDELARSGNRILDGNEPNAYTGNQAPKSLLCRAREALPQELQILELTYSGSATQEQVEEVAAPLGGNPLGVLRARYAAKRWMRDYASVPFDVAPETPILDRAPLPLYESNRMANPEEEVGFEQWMISDIDLCKDIAEFAHFAIALRGGLPTPSEFEAAAVNEVGPAEENDGVGTAGIAAGGALVLASGGALVGLLVLAALAGYYFLMM